jgi:15-cis-phytoene synthase
MKNQFDDVSFICSRKVTQHYSTSFSLGVRMLHKTLRNPIYSLYGFVRLADEIVDSFHDYNKKELLDEYEQAWYQSLKKGISMNPILNAFQETVQKYRIDDDLIRAFFASMKSDLEKKEFTEEEFTQYVFGSADAVGLMCLRIFTGKDDDTYQRLTPYAMHLGSAFQKVNFLRDLEIDTHHLNRTYFPVLTDNGLTPETKKTILEDIENDFQQALQGIRMLPKGARTGVYTAFLYYRALTCKIRKTPPSGILSARIRISNARKTGLLMNAWITCKLNLL